MSNRAEGKTGLVRSQAPALSQSAALSLARRGVQDLLATADAEQLLKQGITLWKQCKYVEAVDCFKHGLERDPNGVELQFFLGSAYYTGLGVADQDYTQAAFWCRKAAELGHPAAQALLGLMYEWSPSLPRDYAQAITWYKKAAEQGDASAGFLLGGCYSEGRGIHRSYERAAEWYRRAAELGHAEAANNIAVCYERGLGVIQDRAQAAFWYDKAVELRKRKDS
jgi:TPR repeat protein